MFKVFIVNKLASVKVKILKYEQIKNLIMIAVLLIILLVLPSYNLVFNLKVTGCSQFCSIFMLVDEAIPKDHLVSIPFSTLQ